MSPLRFECFLTLLHKIESTVILVECFCLLSGFVVCYLKAYCLKKFF